MNRIYQGFYNTHKNIEVIKYSTCEPEGPFEALTVLQVNVRSCHVVFSGILCEHVCLVSSYIRTICAANFRHFFAAHVGLY